MRLAALLFLLLTAPSRGLSSAAVRIAVAANFKATLQNISQQFEQQSGIRVVFSSASTGVLASQINHGAPFDLFFAADRETPFKLKLSGQHSAVSHSATPRAPGSGRWQWQAAPIWRSQT